MEIKNAKIELTKQECQDVIDIAIDCGAIKYWVDDYTKPVVCWRDKNGSIYKLIIIEDETKKEYTINPAVIRKGVNLIVANKNMAPGVRDSILSSLGDFDIDSGDADCIVQAGLFGEIIYG